MRSRTGWYDRTVLDAATRCFHLGPPVSSERTSGQALTISDLRPGHVLCADVRTRDGMLSAAAGNSISALQLERLRNFAAFKGLKEPIYVELGWRAPEPALPH